MSLLKKINPV